MYVKLLHGGLDFFKILPPSPLISCTAAAGRFLIPDSTWAIMSSVGIFLGVTAKFPPLDSTDVSSSVSFRTIRFMTVRVVSVIVVLWVFSRFLNLSWCFLSILRRGRSRL